MIELLIWPFLACVLLTLVHVYFGAIVLNRGIIFIDLALAQWAALGYLVGQWLGIHDSFTLFLLAFGFTLIASTILTVLKPLCTESNIQEGVIGGLYVLATTIATSIISSSKIDGHYLKEMLSGHLLFIQKSELFMAFLIYSLISILIFRKHTLFTSQQTKRSTFLFYVIFGLVVTSSVKMVGVLLVFSYLIIPILTVRLFSSSFKKRVIIGWFLGIISSFIGMCSSMYFDIGPSYCIILSLCSMWLLSSALCLAKQHKKQFIGHS